MEWILAVVLGIGMVMLTTVLVPLLGPLVFAISIFLGIYLGAESLVLASGALLGCLFTFTTNTIYLRTEGAMSPTPSRGRNSSLGFIIAFGLVLLLRFGLGLTLDREGLFLLFLGVLIALSLALYFLQRIKIKSLEIDLDNVSQFEVVEKYSDDPRWAIYLYMRDGTERWNPTIPNSFRAKHPTKDLTFVFDTKQAALDYARRMFSNASPRN